jgi:hypothetical protein
MYDPTGGDAAFLRRDILMAFLGSLDFVEGRTVTKTMTLVLQRCLRCGSRDEGKAIDKFLKSMRIQSDAFFRDIEGDWSGRPFVGEHVFKVVQAAGYEGTEHDLWTTVTGYPAPYPVKMPKAPRAKKAAPDPDDERAKHKAARHKTIKAAWASRA